ncbi:MAG: hypothetical protein ABIG39_04710 [Candidatus Micrarchaeota archaeon]
MKMDINSAWKSTCSLLLGGEIGELEEFGPYLRHYHYVPYMEQKSVISGKKVIIGTDRYGKNPKLISQDEIDYDKKFSLNINEIKDIDSLIESLQNRFHYTGNKVFGNSKFIEDVDNCTDSFYVYKSHNIVTSKYIAYSAFIREDSEYIFGCSTLLKARHLIRAIGGYNFVRCFDSNLITNCSDMFFSVNCHGSTECMFSFNLKSKRYCIGNLDLEKGKYLETKKKLLSEIRGRLRKDKRFISVFDLGLAPIPSYVLEGVKIPKRKPESGNLKPVENAFRGTTKLVFEKELGPLGDYEKFLGERIEKIKETTTPFGNKLYYSNYFWSKRVPEGRMVSKDEAYEAGKMHIELPDGGELKLDDLIEKVKPLAFYPVDLDEGNNENNVKTPILYMATDCYRIGDSTISKKCAYCTHVQDCEAVFGSSILMMKSSYCIRCHDCVRNHACLDMDSCKNCSRCMFCHNCENLQDSAFCFNTKNKRYAIGNVEVGREKYLKIKKMVLEELLKRLEEKGSIGFDICSISEKK